ncbi:MAG: hypothetical protein J7M26_06935 [Armatimonadetes bacterium]|nr:hypothetical protein [Armatimonadota bacterium]
MSKTAIAVVAVILIVVAVVVIWKAAFRPKPKAEPIGPQTINPQAYQEATQGGPMSAPSGPGPAGQ